jgi:hypothetical protein
MSRMQKYVNIWKRLTASIVLLLGVVACASGQPADWLSFDTASATFTVNLQDDSVLGAGFSPGDYVGVFFNDKGKKICAGYSKVPFTSIVAYRQSDSATAGKYRDGFLDGDTIYYKLYRTKEACISEPLYPQYISGKPDPFISGGYTVIKSLTQDTAVYFFYPDVCTDIGFVEPDIRHLKDTNYRFSAVGHTLPVDSLTGAVNVSAAAAGVYQIRLVSPGNCPQIITTYLTVNKITLELGPDKTICAGSSVSLFDISGESPSGKTFRWNTGNIYPAIQVQIPGIYSLTVTDSNNCSATDAVVVRDGSINTDSLKINVNPAVCGGKGMVSISNLPPEFEKFSLESVTDKKVFGDSLTTLEADPGKYILKIHSRTCTSVYPDTIEIEQIQPDTKGFQYEISDETCGLKGSIDITKYPDAGGFTSVLLFDLQSGDTIQAITGKFAELDSGAYKVIFTSPGCVSEAPQVITVNKEDCQKEDLLLIGDPEGGSININMTGKIRIFDRYGNLQNEFTAPADWDGKDFSGEYVPMGQYAIVSENEEKKLILVVW